MNRSHKNLNTSFGAAICTHLFRPTLVLTSALACFFPPYLLPLEYTRSVPRVSSRFAESHFTESRFAECRVNLSFHHFHLKFLSLMR